MTNSAGLLSGILWLPVADANRAARALYERHYSCRHYADGRRRMKFIGPGEYLCLMTPDDRALFVWRKFRSRDRVHGATGINCAVFRNEGPHLSSDLIREADELAWARWPEESRHYTYINPREVRSHNPGYCFLCAGWWRCGVTKGGLLVLEKRQ